MLTESHKPAITIYDPMNFKRTEQTHANEISSFRNPIIPPVALFILVVLSMAGFDYLLMDDMLHISGYFSISLGLYILGGLIAMCGVLEFRRQTTTVDPLHPGKASTLVCSGIYQYTRNPMYLGLVIILTGWAIHLGNIYATGIILLFAGYLNYFQIIPEEQAMRSKFGEEYQSYIDDVRRWI